MLNYSVALCTYNGEKYIREQLISILTQTKKPKEIIISDDGSTDKTLEIVDTLLCTESIKYQIVKNPVRDGVGANFSNAISLCNESIIFTSDQDDVWLPNKAEIIVNNFENNEDALLIFTNGELVDSNLKPLNRNMWDCVGITEKELKEKNWFEYMLSRCFITGATMAFRRVLFSKSDVVPSGWLHDSWLAWMACARQGILPCNEKLILYRQHENNVIGMKSTSFAKRVKNYLRHFKTLRDSHAKHLKKYIDIKNKFGCYFNKRQQDELDLYVLFWGDLVECDSNTNRLFRLKLILKHTINGDFRRIDNGMLGSLREIVVAMFY